MIQSIAFSPSEINVSNGAQGVTVAVRITDAQSGVASGSVQFSSPSGGQNVIASYGASSRISGDAKDGVYSVGMSFPQGSEAGQWKISFASATDLSNNPSHLLSPQTTPPALTVVNQLAPGATITFGAASYHFSEGAGRATVSVARAGDASGVATVDYLTADADTFTVGCADSVNNAGGAFARCDFSTVVGTVQFAAGETSKSVTVPIIDDGHAEGSETFQLRLSAATGATLGTPNVTTVTIQDDDAAGAANPVTTSTTFFVRQQYLDFLSREPDAGGFNAWVGVLNGCPDIFAPPQTPSQCDRIYVSGEGFFRSAEFQLKGSYVLRFYRLAFNRLPEYSEIVTDMSFVAGATEAEVYARKAQLATLVTQRAEFQTLYGGTTNAQYVAALLGRYGLAQITAPDPQQPDTGGKVTLTGAELSGRLDTGALTRAQVLRAVADSDQAGAAEFDGTFVAMQYYGYLRRKPEPGGYDAWLRVLRGGDARTMVNGFLNSGEYRLRFGQP